MTMVDVTAEAARIAPTERSMPLERMTKVCPTAISAITAAWTVISNRLLTVKK